MRLQQGVLGGVPTTRWSKPLRTSPQTPSFNVSLGHVACGGGDAGEGLGWGFGAVGDGGQLVELTRVKKRRLTVRRKAAEDETLEAIFVVGGRRSFLNGEDGKMWRG